MIFRVETFFEWLFFVQGRKWRASCRNERPADSAVPGWTLVHAAPTPLSDFTFLKWRIKFPHFYRTVSKFSLEIVYIGDDAFLSNRDIASNEGSAQYPIQNPTDLSNPIVDELLVVAVIARCRRTPRGWPISSEARVKSGFKGVAFWRIWRVLDFVSMNFAWVVICWTASYDVIKFRIASWN